MLLTTFSRPLATALDNKLKILIGDKPSIVPRVTVTPFRGVAEQLYELEYGYRPHAPTGSAASLRDPSFSRIFNEA
ncbi:MAG TPA: hypothetical protein VH684_21600 [Xanthobacteraceae bacterium]